MNRHERRKAAAEYRVESRKAIKRHLPIAGRQCGECTACCTTLAVHEIEKKPYEKCVHEAGKCGIYKDRPKSCRDWRCGWHIGFLKEEDRPDKLGVVIDSTKDSKMIVLWELYEGAAETPKVRALIDAWSVNIPVIIAFKDKRRIVGTSENVDLQLLY